MAKMDKARVEVTEEAFEEEFLSRVEAEGSFGYTTDYAGHVNYPTEYSGSPPPYTPIRKWVHRKWNDLDAGLKDYAHREGMSRDAHKDAVAHIVRNAIAENGTSGVYFMERSVEQVKQVWEQLAAPYENTDDPDAPYKILRDVLDYAFGYSQDIVADESSDTGNLLQSGFVDVYQLNGPLSHSEGDE